MRELIIEFRYVIAWVFGAILFCLFEWQLVKGRLYALMLQAKSLAKQTVENGKSAAKNAVLLSGSSQEEWVVRKAYKFLPRSLTIFISEEVMRKIVRYLYRVSKDYLDDGKLNNSI